MTGWKKRQARTTYVEAKKRDEQAEKRVWFGAFVNNSQLSKHKPKFKVEAAHPT